MTSIVVSGAAGRLGQRVLDRAGAADDIEVAAALVRSGSAMEGATIPALAPLTFTADPAVIRPGTVLVEVATRAAAMAHAAQAAEVGAPMIVATTGFDAEEQRQLQAYSVRAPLLIAPNLSMGIAVLLDLVERASRALAAYDLEVLELHHRRKRDAPSGTAWALGAAAAAARGQDIERDAICARAGEVGARGDQEVGMQSIRGGDIIGEHTVYLAGETERLELTHRAANRDAFAAGAIVAARYMGASDRQPGLYTVRDVLGLNTA